MRILLQLSFLLNTTCNIAKIPNHNPLHSSQRRGCQSQALLHVFSLYSDVSLDTTSMMLLVFDMKTVSLERKYQIECHPAYGCSPSPP